MDWHAMRWLTPPATGGFRLEAAFRATYGNQAGLTAVLETCRLMPPISTEPY